MGNKLLAFFLKERLMNELESEGWIEYNKDQARVTLKRSFLDIES